MAVCVCVCYVTSQLEQLSLASLRGQQIDYQLNLAGVEAGMSSLLGGRQHCDPIWHASSHSGEMVSPAAC